MQTSSNKDLLQIYLCYSLFCMFLLLKQSPKYNCFVWKNFASISFYVFFAILKHSFPKSGFSKDICVHWAQKCTKDKKWSKICTNDIILMQNSCIDNVIFWDHLEWSNTQISCNIGKSVKNLAGIFGFFFVGVFLIKHGNLWIIFNSSEKNWLFQ